jgi:hypothetical protein
MMSEIAGGGGLGGGACCVQCFAGTMSTELT